MSRRNKAAEEAEAWSRMIEALTVEALRRSGDVVPASKDDVAALESVSSDSDEPTPPSLLTPPDLFESEKPPRPRILLSRNKQTEENLARAAREGGEIPAAIDEKMRRDREAAERDEQEE